MARNEFSPFKHLGQETYVRRIGRKTLRYHVLSVENPEDWGDNAREQYGAHYVQLKEIDLGKLSFSRVSDALRSHGLRLVAGKDGGPAIECEYSGAMCAESMADVHMVIVECCAFYGAYAPIHQGSGNNLRRLVREAKKESRAVGSYGLESTDDRMVNAIGQTPEQYMVGESWLGV